MSQSRRTYNSESSRRHSRHHSGDRDLRYSNNSRAFNYGSRSSAQSRPAETYSSRSHTGPSRTNTYGTYIWPLDEWRSVSRSHEDSREHRYPNAQSSRRNSSYKPTQDRPPTPYSSRPTNDRRAPWDDRFIIDVVDHTDSSLSRRYGRNYPITLSETSSVHGVVSFLAPDQRRAKVVVHWKDGEIEPLDQQVPIKEMKKYARYIEVRQRKKVHFA